MPSPKTQVVTRLSVESARRLRQLWLDANITQAEVARHAIEFALIDPKFQLYLQQRQRPKLPPLAVPVRKAK